MAITNPIMTADNAMQTNICQRLFAQIASSGSSR